MRATADAVVIGGGIIGASVAHFLTELGYGDVVLVDGHSRLSCTEAAHRTFADDGLIIFDNSDKPMYAPALKILGDLGYLRIDFAGTRPNETLWGCTSVYSRAMDKWLGRARTKAPPYWGRSISEFSWR